MQGRDPTSRRDFLANAAVLACLAPGLGVATKYVIDFLVPRRGGRTEEILLERLDRLPIGSSRLFKGVLGNDLIAVRLAGGETRVFSSICTHLGCAVQWDPVEGNFLCPCHMGRFDTSGKVIAGPPPAPLPSYPVRIEGETLFVTVPVLET